MPLDPQGDLEKEFVQAALARSKYLRQGDATKAGREREKLRAIAARIRALEDRGLVPKSSDYLYNWKSSESEQKRGLKGRLNGRTYRCILER